MHRLQHQQENQPNQQQQQQQQQQNHHHNQKTIYRGKEFMAATIAAAVATTLSAPVNYARNIQYSVALGQPAPSIYQAIKQLVEETKRYPPQTKYAHLSNQLQFGWGTARVTIGMAVGQLVYESARDYFITKVEH